MIESLEVRNVVKRFSGVTALKNMHFKLRGGSVHCLVGENGAGKSTLIKILAGHYMPDEGEIALDGQPLRIANPRESQRLGISIIHQELLLVPELSVAENISLGRLPKAGSGLIDWKSAQQKAASSLALLNAAIDPKSKVAELSTGEQQLVEIARSLSVDTKILILDEPTASLSESETSRLLSIIKDLKKRGLAILYVSHRMEEVFDLADDITVIRDGAVVQSASKEEMDPDKVVRLMVGRDVSLERKNKGVHGRKVLEVRGLGRSGALRNVNFHLHEGEIVGFAGLVGSGRTEIARCLFGVDRIDEGEIILQNETVRIRDPLDAIRKGIGLVPEDRKNQGLVLQGSVKNNATLSVLGRLQRFGWIKGGQETDLVQSYKEQLRIKTPSIDTPVSSLSGGNQQ
ncbi:sugar ABC transporter ATP-binding protein [Cohnella sp. GbtcB17]|uniref:sugar ABC transporter ATP-binding protein n=1 Tax=Cohnella sp. GbtcB17 TaxID=2824762 RepID=UPI001C3026C3|nr:sugar ABC transporter ATP-binding protein [Cohnella sp. GbtcB17]